MELSRSKLTLCVVVILPLLGGLAWAFSAGPTESVTGAPGEGTCANPACHTSFLVNSGSGTLNLTAPAQYTPGDTLDLSVQLQQNGQQRWGFQLTVIDDLGHPVGTILVSDPTRTWIETGAGGRQYLVHTRIGTDSGTADASPGWNFRWKAPAPGAGTVRFYAAGNAANGDGTNLSDYVYTDSVTLSEGTASVDESGGTRPNGWYLSANYPNPFNAGTRIRFVLDQIASGPVSLNIHDVSGRRVRTLITDRYFGPGEHGIDWDGRDDRAVEVPSGTFFAALTTRAGSVSRKLSLVR